MYKILTSRCDKVLLKFKLKFHDIIVNISPSKFMPWFILQHAMMFILNLNQNSPKQTEQGKFISQHHLFYGISFKIP